MTTHPIPEVAALILAADALEDGTPRAVGSWGRTTTVEHVVSVVAPLFDTTVVVLGSDGDRIVDSTRLDDVTVVVDPEWSEGASSPLRAGLDTLSRVDGVEHVVVIDLATPQVDTAVVAELLEAHLATPHARPGRRVGDRGATVGRYRYARSGPVVIARELWERFLSMEGATPILQVLSAHPDWVSEVWIDQLPPIEVHDADDLANIAPRV